VASGLAVNLDRLDRFGRFLENVALVTLLSGLILLAVSQIVLREIFDTGIIWADELVRLIVLWLAMMGAVAACREDRHIRIDAITHLFPDRVIDVIRIGVDVFAAAVCGVIAWHAYRYLQIEIEFADTVLVDMPAWIAHVVVPASFAVLSYRFIVSVIKKIHGLMYEESQVIT
jgi:TRAP-type C4-dicarboxylate transport system permease small subunit